MLVQGTVFSGIGGPELAAEWMGWENAFHCEWNEFGKQVLKYYWPNATTYHDITKTDFSIWRNRIDVLTGGFPCQPYSISGKRKGKNDDRHLWPEMRRAIQEVAPVYVVGENVRGLVSWNGGLVFDKVQTDLENEGYEVFPIILPAASVNAPHRRDRIFFVAYSESLGRRKRERETVDGNRREDSEHKSKRNEVRDWDSTTSGAGISSDTYSNRFSKQTHEANDDRQFEEREKEGSELATHIKQQGIAIPLRDVTYTESKGSAGLSSRKEKEKSLNGKFSSNGDASNSFSFGQRRQSDGIGKTGQSNQESKINDWENFPTQSPICDGDDGLSSRLDFDSVFEGVKNPRDPAKAFNRWRKQSIMAGGNAIVPQVIHQIFKAIESHALSQIQ